MKVEFIKIAVAISIALMLLACFTVYGQWVEMKKYYVTMPFNYTKGDTIWVYANKADSLDVINQLGIKIWKAY